jgi:hypothetical protein
MLDETIITETPPLYSAYGHIGVQVRVPITGNRAKRILHGAINVRSGDVTLLITEEWVNETHQAFLAMVRDWRQLFFPADDNYFSRSHQPNLIMPGASSAGPSWPAPRGSSGRSAR